jgi:hypothetical protein
MARLRWDRSILADGRKPGARDGAVRAPVKTLGAEATTIKSSQSLAYRACRTLAIMKMRQMACKPGSVPAGLPAMDGHSSGMCVATHLTRPTRAAIRKRITCRPYLVLLPVGLALPLLLPGTRCALTAPFQPCRGFRPVGGVISVALSLGSPPPDVIRHRVSVEPGLSSTPCFRKTPQPSSHLTHT